jgi:hypothetical protein
MVARRQRRRDESAALALVPDRAPAEDDKATQERQLQAARDVADRMLGYLDQADAGDEAALAKLNDLLRQAPYAASKLISGLDYSAETELLGMFGLHWRAGGLAINRTQLQERRRALLGEHPSELERLIVGQLMRDWLWCLALDMKYSIAFREGLSLATGEFWGKQRERAHRQFTATAKTLATIRAAQTPALAMIVNP